MRPSVKQITHRMGPIFDWLAIHPWMGVIGAITTTFVTTAIGSIVGRLIQFNYIDFLLADWSRPIAITLLFFLVLSVFIMAGRKRLSDREIEKKNEEEFKRFEDISDRLVKYGYITFNPTLKSDGTKLSGVGVELIQKVFEGANLSNSPKRTSWSNFEKGFADNQFHFLVTPVYDTPERRRFVDFSLPIFYTDIGLFAPLRGKVIEWILEQEDGKNCYGRNGVAFNPLIELIKQGVGRNTESTFVLRTYPGELHDRMVRKYIGDCPGAVIKEMMDDHGYVDVLDLVNHVVEYSDESRRSELVFAERFQGQLVPGFVPYDEALELAKSEKRAALDGKFTNILEPQNLMFPTCYPIKKGEDTLRKFLNLRLMELEGDQRSGIDDMLIDVMSKMHPDVSIDDILSCYTRGENKIGKGKITRKENVLRIVE